MALIILFGGDLVHADVCATQGSSNDSMRFGYNNTSEYYGAAKFVPSMDCTVDSLEASIEAITVPIGTLTLSIYNNSASAPGTELEQCGAIVPTGSFSLLTSTCSGTTAVTNGVTYWIVAKSTATPDATNYYRWEAQDSNLGLGLKRGPTSWTDWDNAGAGGVYTVNGTSGGGGGGSTNGEATSSVEQTETNLWYAYWTFFATLWFVVWMFRKR